MGAARPYWGYVWAFAATAACTAAGLALAPFFEAVNIAMVYLLAVVVVALRTTRGAAVLTSVLSVAAFDFFFVPPRFTFAVSNMQYLVTFATMLAVALIISALVALVRQAEVEYLRSTLLASISHDLRTPLAVISGAASSLEERGERLSAEDRRQLARSIYRHAGDMTEIVTNVLQMTRLQHSAVELKRDWLVPGEAVGSALARLGERLSSHPVEIDLPEDLPLVRADAMLIEQVLTNLLENAAKYTPTGTRIWVRARMRENELLLMVEDEGPGLPPGADAVLFEKLQRGEAESTVAGLGLGLSICRAIVQLHHGKIWVERRPQGGTSFRFTLPVEEMPSIPAEAASPAERHG